MHHELFVMRGHARLLKVKLKTTDQAGNYTEVDRKSQFKGSELPPSSGGTEIPAQNSFRKGTGKAIGTCSECFLAYAAIFAAVAVDSGGENF